MNSPLPPALAEAISNKRLLIFCGAGVSMLSPSNLPSWWGFNQSILEEAKRLTLKDFPELTKETKDKIRALSLNNIPVESFSDTLVGTFAGSGYFPMLEILDSTQPNANHRAFAELGRSGIAKVFVTTNFDTLIEQSFRNMAVPLNVYVDEKDYQVYSPEPYNCEIYKIHGSVKSVSSLVDTVTQKLRGISLQTRSRLAALFRNYHILVLGYSGADLIFGDDYLAFSSINEDFPGITWLIQPGKQPSERVRQTVERAGSKGAIIEGVLPDFLESLGVAVTQLSPAAAGVSNAQAASVMEKRIREFFAQVYVGKFSSAAFCARLFQIIGDDLTVNSICKVLAAHPELNSEKVPIVAAIAFGMLAGWAMQKHDFTQAVHWLKRDLGLHAGMARQYKDHNEPVPLNVSLEWNRNLAGIHSNLGLCFIQLDEMQLARTAFDEARRNAEEAQDYGGLSLVYMNMAQLENAAGGSPDYILNLFHIARAFAQDAGMAQTAFQSNTLEANTLISIAEYDEAHARLRQAEQYLGIFGGLQSRVELSILQANLALLRGELDESRAILLECAALADKQGSPIIADRLRLKFCFFLSFHAPFRKEIVKELRKLRKKYKDPQQEAIDIEGIENLLKMLRDKKDPLNKPSFNFAFLDGEDTESQVRREIAGCEFTKDLLPLPGYFDWLWRKKYGEGNPDRMLALANALLKASQRVNDLEHCARAFNYLGISRDLLGDIKGALEAYQNALEIEGLSPETRREVKLHSALAKSKLSESGEAQEIFNELIREYGDSGDTEKLIRSMRALAHHLARHERMNDAIRQLETALTYCDTAELKDFKRKHRKPIKPMEGTSQGGRESRVSS